MRTGSGVSGKTTDRPIIAFAENSFDTSGKPGVSEWERRERGELRPMQVERALRGPITHSHDQTGQRPLRWLQLAVSIAIQQPKQCTRLAGPVLVLIPACGRDNTISSFRHVTAERPDVAATTWRVFIVTEEQGELRFKRVERAETVSRLS
jgi:hypothetical protein